MKKMTVRIEDEVFEKLSQKSDEANISINKYINKIICEHINNNMEFDYVKTILKHLDKIEERLVNISKKQYLHFNISSYLFANHAYLSNANPNDDKCLNEILKKKDNFNE